MSNLSNANTQALPALNDWDDLSDTGDARLLRSRPNLYDVVFFVLLAIAAGVTLDRFSTAMDYYEQVILCYAVPVLTWMG